MIQENIFSYIKSEEANFESDQVRVGDNWTWNLRDHVQLIFHLKNGVFYTGENDYMRAFKQVMRPLLRLSYWTEDIEVKDVVFFIENSAGRVLSFLIKKYHDEVYVRENNLDTLFDEITESDIDYGGVLTQKTNTKRPETLPLNSLAFCDQTDIMGGPICFKHGFSPDGLRKMTKNGWGKPENGATISIEDLIVEATFEREPDSLLNTKSNQVPGKVIEVYLLRGNLPEHYLLDNEEMEYFCPQVQIVAFYQTTEKKQKACILYRKKEEEGAIKFHASEKIHGRALGYSDGEAFISPQIWTNWLTIHKNALQQAASKVVLQTDDESYEQKNQNLQDVENLQILTVAEGKQIGFVPTVGSQNIGVLSEAVNEWFDHAQLLGNAFDPILGKEAASGTTFRGQERVVAQGRGWHDRRRGQRAKFLEEIYRDWIIPQIVKEITKGKQFLASLTADELTWVAEQLATNYANRKIKEMMFEGKVPTPEAQETLKTTFKEQFTKGGNKRLIEIVKGEFDGIEVKIGINIANKQKDLANLSDKLLSIFQFVFANPAGFQQAMQIPALAKSFQDILEYSGLNQTDFLSLIRPPAQLPAGPAQPAAPQQPIALNPQPVEA